MPTAKRRVKDKVRRAAGVPKGQKTPLEVEEAIPEILASVEAERVEMTAREVVELQVIEKESELATMRRVLNQSWKEDRTPKEKRFRLSLNEDLNKYLNQMRMWEREELGAISRNQVARVAEVEPDEKAGEIQVLIGELLDRCNGVVQSGHKKRS